VPVDSTAPTSPPDGPAVREARRRARREAALAARPSLCPPGPAPDRFRLATWNVNSVRVRLPAIERFLDHAAPDVLCVQETRIGELPPAATAALEARGYRTEHVGERATNGCLVATRHDLLDPVGSGRFGVEVLDREPRVAGGLVVAGDLRVRVLSVYVPHGREVGHWHYEFKLAFLQALTDVVHERLAAGEHVVVAGDLNVATTDSDVFHPDAFVGSTHVTEQERDALRRLLDAGLADVDVALHGARARRFTWWNHGIGYSRNLGMRIDLILADHGLAAGAAATWIDHAERGATRPSDHAALVADFDLALVR
jgi:exodeoxyribonuclease-3